MEDMEIKYVVFEYFNQEIHHFAFWLSILNIFPKIA